MRGDFEEKILEIGDQVAALAAKTANVNLPALADCGIAQADVCWMR